MRAFEAIVGGGVATTTLAFGALVTLVAVAHDAPPRRHHPAYAAYDKAIEERVRRHHDDISVERAWPHHVKTEAERNNYAAQIQSLLAAQHEAVRPCHGGVTITKAQREGTVFPLERLERERKNEEIEHLVTAGIGHSITKAELERMQTLDLPDDPPSTTPEEAVLHRIKTAKFDGCVDDWAKRENRRFEIRLRMTVDTAGHGHDARVDDRSSVDESLAVCLQHATLRVSFPKLVNEVSVLQILRYDPTDRRAHVWSVIDR